MTAEGWIEIALFCAVLTALTPPLGAYMARVYPDEPVFLDPLARPLERLSHRLLRTDTAPQGWKAYGRSLLVFSAVCTVALYALVRTQGVPWDVSFNTAISFASNTSWQFYAGETTLSTFAQMAGIGVHSFLSAAVGLTAAVAVIRGIAARSPSALGNFWWDLIRSLLYVIVPLAVIGTLVLVASGVVQALDAPQAVRTLLGGEQTLVVGPVASQAAIKTLGSVGGGYFNVNSAFPFENGGELSNFAQALLIVLVPAALTATFGRMVGSRRQGWLLFAAMLGMFVVSVAVMYGAESASTPAMDAAGVHGANLEGKEQRFGIGSTALYATSTTTGSSGAVDAAMESFSALGGLVAMANMTSGEVIFGGIGSGLIGMLLLVVVGVFLAGLMVGRTPTYLGKRIGLREMRFVLAGVLGVELVVLATVAIAIATDYGRASIFSAGPQGFSESLYAYTSQAFNNGSAFAGYTGYVQPNAPGNAGAFGISFANVLGGLTMLAGRYVPLLSALALAGALAAQRPQRAGAGTLRTDTPTFLLLLLGVVLVVVLLTFLPALLLGPGVQALGDGLQPAS